jgi:hypothetical protein
MQKHKPEIYVSTDIEADGWIPGQNSMLSLASAAYLADKTLLSTFSVNLEALPETKPSPKTMAWWQNFPEAWAACRQNCQSPKQALSAYYQWLMNLPGQIIFVAQPLIFDFAFVQYYLLRFVGENPFGLAAIDIRSYAMGLCNKDFRHSQFHTTENNYPIEWYDNLPHTHIALDDALEQGAFFCNMLAVQKKRDKIERLFKTN